MARHHNILEEDLPSQSDRERDRLRIEKAITEYFSRGGSIQRVEADQRVNDPSFIINAEKTALLKAGTESQKQKKQMRSAIPSWHACLELTALPVHHSFQQLRRSIKRVSVVKP